MSYPKYLSINNHEKRYRDSGISESKIRFLKDLCLSAMNLYRAIHAEQLWDVYKELSEKTAVPKIQRKELYAALCIFRREDLPYFHCLPLFGKSSSFLILSDWTGRHHHFIFMAIVHFRYRELWYTLDQRTANELGGQKQE